MNRRLLLAGILIAGLGLAGCTEPAPAPEDQSPTETPRPARPPAEDAPADRADERPEAGDPPADPPDEQPAAGTPADEPPAGEKAEETAPAPADPPSPGKDDASARTDLAPEIQADYWLNSDPLSLADLRGKIVVLEFWATWCPPCRTTIPHLIKMYNQYKDRGVAFVSLTGEPRRKVEPFVQRMKMPYPVGGGSPTGRTYGVRGIPHAFIIDPSGRVVAHGHPMGGLEAALKKQLEKTPPTK